MFIAAFDAQYPNTFTWAYFQVGSPWLAIDPSSLETFTIRPASDFLNSGRTACVTATAPRKLVRSTRSTASRLVRLGGPARRSAMPALFTRASRLPKSPSPRPAPPHAGAHPADIQLDEPHVEPFAREGRRCLTAACRIPCPKQDHDPRLGHPACDFEADAFVGARHERHRLLHRSAPPLSNRCWPLTNEERSLAKYSAASAASFTDPMRALGRYAFAAARYEGSTPCPKIPAPSVAVGRMELTVTPRGPSSFASTSTKYCPKILLPP